MTNSLVADLLRRHAIRTIQEAQMRADELHAIANQLEQRPDQTPIAAPEVLTLGLFARAINRCDYTARLMVRMHRDLLGAFQAKKGGRWQIPRAGLEAYLAMMSRQGSGARSSKTPDFSRHLIGTKN